MSILDKSLEVPASKVKSPLYLESWSPPPFVKNRLLRWGLLIGFVIFFAGLRISLLVLDIMRRDNMNYDKFNWDFTPPTEVMPKYVEEPEEVRVITSLLDNIENANVTKVTGANYKCNKI